MRTIVICPKCGFAGSMEEGDRPKVHCPGDNALLCYTGLSQEAWDGLSREEQQTCIAKYCPGGSKKTESIEREEVPAPKEAVPAAPSALEGQVSQMAKDIRKMKGWLIAFCIVTLVGSLLLWLLTIAVTY